VHVVALIIFDQEVPVIAALQKIAVLKILCVKEF
jgi:hypothetical protein